jgi:hypothetical protein
VRLGEKSYEICLLKGDRKILRASAESARAGQRER